MDANDRSRESALVPHTTRTNGGDEGMEASAVVTGGSSAKETQGGFLPAMEVLFRWRNFIILNVILVVIVVAAVSFIVPEYYRATASVLPPKQQDMFSLSGMASSLAKSIPGASKLGLGQRSSSYNFFAILNSRTALEQIVREFNLRAVYEIKDSSMEKAVRVLSGKVSFEEQSDESISIEVTDRDRVRAANMANAFVRVLNEISARMGTAEARNNREFIENRLDQSRRDLRAAEEALQAYQEKTKTIINPQESSTASGFASLYALRAKKEVELAVLRHGMVEDNAVIQGLKVEIAELDKKLASMPGIGVESVRRYRDVLIQQQILEYLVPMYEQARIDEVKELPVVLVLDKAVPPERRISPQRSIYVIVGFTLSFFFFVVLAFMLQGLSQQLPTGPLAVRLRTLSLAIARRYRVRL